MSDIIMTPKKNLRGEVFIPSDKSISHRAIMCGALAQGVTEINNLLLSDDCMSTIDCFKKSGIRIDKEDKIFKVYGKGLNGLKAYNGTLLGQFRDDNEAYQRNTCRTKLCKQIRRRCINQKKTNEQNHFTLNFNGS